MQTQELERIRYITQSYEALKGLKMVPFGLFMIVMAIRQFGWDGLGRQGDCTYTIPLFVLVLIGYFAADRYYTRTFGVVRIQNATSTPLFTLIALAVFIGVIVLENVIRPPFSLLSLLIGVVLVVASTRVRVRRAYYFVAGAALVGISLVPLFFPATSQSFGTFGVWWNLLFGLAWTVLGLVDHWMLVKAMKPARGGEDA